MIIELYGLPGSGKSYTIQQLNGGKPIGMETKNKIKKRIISCCKKLAIWMPDSLSLKKKLKSEVINLQTSPMFIERTINEYINNLVMIAFGYRWTNGNKKLYMDEGIVHRVVSFAVNYNMSIDQMMKVLDILKKYIDKAIVVYLDVEITDCLNSIVKRNRHQYKMDNMNRKQLELFLSSYIKYFDAINSRFGFYHITRDSINQLKEIIK